ncbi:peptidase inhibitor family I36 protein [Streptomyces alboflavus]|uniref:peptidase inhibitor family I36 protein n=1 Tax=Streptomyces alboflavus TaxID=67267 RepID=UPI0036B9666A
MRTTRTFLISTATAAAAALALAVPTAASGAESDTRGEKLCVYQNTNFNFFGGIEQCFYPGSHNIKANLDNKASSVDNETSTTMCAYQLKNQKGLKLRIGSGHYFKDLSKDIADDDRSWDNRISSVGKC